jgi:transcriptional regulator with XRE-family HTH domain
MSKQITKLKLLRESKFLSMKDLAEKADVTAQTISNAEAGKRISLGSIRRIALALKVAPEKLL